MRNTLETRVGLFFALALVVGAILFETIAASTCSAAVASSGAVQQRHGTPGRRRVKIAGKQVGRVTSIGFADAKVLVGMRISDNTAMIRDDARHHQVQRTDGTELRLD
jgi:ABC-type transporter Mla subunit MlaD